MKHDGLPDKSAGRDFRASAHQVELAVILVTRFAIGPSQNSIVTEDPKI